MSEAVPEKIICSRCKEICRDENGQVIRNFLKPTETSDAICFQCRYGCAPRANGEMQEAAESVAPSASGNRRIAY